MNPQPENAPAAKNQFATGEAESTLRLIAGLPAPEGLETRVKAALYRVSAQGKAATLLDWSSVRRQGWLHSTFVRIAAAAAIVGVVAGGSWGVYSRVQPREGPIALPHVGTGGFSSANAMRTPKTLDGPTLTHPVLPHAGKDARSEPVSADAKTQVLKRKSAGKSSVAKPAAQ